LIILNVIVGVFQRKTGEKPSTNDWLHRLQGLAQ